MNAIISTLYRDLTCAAAALLISLGLGASFVQSTAAAPGCLRPLPRLVPRMPDSNDPNDQGVSHEHLHLNALS